MGNSKEWRKEQRILSDEELRLLTKNIKDNMRNYDKDIGARMERSDRIELDMNKKSRISTADNIR